MPHIQATGFYMVQSQESGLVKCGLQYNHHVVEYNAGGASIAPAGWHVPSRTELNTLITELGGSTVAGGHLKEIGYVFWNSPNTDADNSSGFSAKAAGTRSATDGSFLNLLGGAFIWSTTLASLPIRAFFLQLYYNSAQANATQIALKAQGMSIVCIKDDDTDPGTVTDYDGNVYPTVKIGDQVWMASYLRVMHFNDGIEIPEVTNNAAWAALTDAALCAYDNDWDNVMI